MAADLERRFGGLGGHFVVPADDIASRLRRTRALVFDWDGVFNAGVKGGGAASGFSEPDSMGTNMLRFALWRERGVQPICALVSGADNPGAREFANREHFHDAFCGIRDKSAAFATLLGAHRLSFDEVAYVFDDINDLGVARSCGLRVLVRREASPLLADHVVERALCEYVTGREASQYAVREVCELLIGTLDQYDAVVTARSAVDADYARFFAERQRIATEIHDAG